MKILCMVRPNSACDYHRIILPMTTMPPAEGDKWQAIYHPEQLTYHMLTLYDAVFFNRAAPYDIDYLKRCREDNDLKIIMDLDDYWELYVQHEAYSSWKKEGIGESIKKCMILSDAVITTNNRLAQQIAYFNRNVHIVPNALPFGRFQFSEWKVTNQEKIRFGYVGGNSHYWDLKSIVHVFSKIKNFVNMKDKSIIYLAGYISDSDYWNKAFNIINESGIGAKLMALKLDRYMNHYKYIDVALCPLEENKFNSFKSNLKILEAGCKRIPVIASKVYPYLEDQEMDGKGLFLCSKPREWIEAMRVFTNDPTKIQEMGETLYQYVIKKYNLEDANQKRYKILKDICN